MNPALTDGFLALPGGMIAGGNIIASAGNDFESSESPSLDLFVPIFGVDWGREENEAGI